MPNASSDKPWLQDFEQMLSRWAAHVRAQAEAGAQSPAAAALLDELLHSWAAFVQQPSDSRRADQGQPPADWLARTASNGPPAHWLAYIREKAPHLLDETGELRLTMATAVPPTDPTLPPIVAGVSPDTIATPPVTDAQPAESPPAAAKPVETAVVTPPPAPDLPPPTTATPAQPAVLKKTPPTRPSTVRLSPAPLPAADAHLPTAAPAPTPSPTPRPAPTPPDKKSVGDEMHAAESDLPSAPPEIVFPVSAQEIKREPVGRTAVSARQPLQLKPVPTRPHTAHTTPATTAPHSPPRDYSVSRPLPAEEVVTLRPSPLVPPVEPAQPRQEPARLPQWPPAAQENVSYAPKKPGHGRVPFAPDPLPPDPPPPIWQQASGPTAADLPEPTPRHAEETAVPSPMTTPSWPELPPDTPRLSDETPTDNPPPWLVYRLALEQQRRERLDREQRGTQWNASPF
ncbi:MAG: hypothetical protein KBE23_19415 [Chloroflexi bacterium]|nr:hypothetical protein [Chloroflexota bacterium]MBP7044930.1 hypothetical protein [Chloroflexota bacterium]